MSARVNISPNIARSLLRWYDRHARVLPWRKQGQGPYRVWLSEIMLQQTTVVTVIPYYQKFLAKWPTVKDLAKASQEEVLAAWAGLGYYSRARNLHAAAQILSRNFPRTEAELLKIPGIGPYTAAAIAAIAFDQPTNVVDGNVERVMARLHAVESPDKKHLKAISAQYVPQKRAGDYAQALMDLGATLCTPRSPDCSHCPLKPQCKAENPENYPVRGQKKARPVRRGVVFVLQDEKGRFWLRRRPSKGLLGGMLEFPSSPWEAGDFPGVKEAQTSLGVSHLPKTWKLLRHPIRHVFTHFDLELRLAVAVSGRKHPEGLWLQAKEAGQEALPSLMKKVMTAATRVKMAKS